MAAPASTTAPASAVEHVAEVPKQTEPKVYIGNLDYKTTEEDVRKFVAGAGGKISSVVLPLKYGKRPAGFAIVTYESQSDAEAVVEKLQESELDGRKLKIQLSRSDEERDAARAKRDAARDAKRAADKKKKQEAAAAAAPAAETAAVEGEATKEKKTKKRTSRRRVPGEEGEEEEAAEGETTDAAAVTETKTKSKRKPKKAPAAAEARIDGEAEATTEAETKKPREKKERKPREKSLVPTGEDSKDTLFVSNLPYDLTDDSLAAIFTNLSIEVKSAKIIRQVRGVYRGKKENAKTVNTEPRSKGFGFVEIANPAQRDEAVEKAAGTLIQTREIGVKVAKEMVKVEKQKNEGGAGAAVGQAPDQDESNIQATPEKATA